MRKLISFSKGSYILSMPKSWVEKNHLKKGDLLKINESDYELVITPNFLGEEKGDIKEVTIDAANKSIECIKAEIVSSYLNNAGIITLASKNLNQNAQEIKSIIRNLAGMEIMEQSSSRIMAKNLINLNEISVKNLIRRMDIITRAMIDEAMLSAKNHEEHENIKNRDVDVNRLYFLLRRVINSAFKNPGVARTLGTSLYQLACDIAVITRIEIIADTQKRIARYLAKANLTREALNELEALQYQLGEKYKEVMKAYYNTDKKLASDIDVTNKQRVKLYDHFLEKYTCKEYNKKIEKSKKIGISKEMDSVAIVKIIYNLKSMANSTVHIARTVMCYE